MVYQHDESSDDRFQEFINHNLDMGSIMPLSATDIEASIHAMFSDLMADVEYINPDDYLDELQSLVRRALSAAIVDQLVPQRTEFNQTDPQALEWLIRLSVTLGFAFHNELLDRTDVHEARPDDDADNARRLRVMLMRSLAWARTAADTGSAAAAGLVDQADSLLHETSRYS